MAKAPGHHISHSLQSPPSCKRLSYHTVWDSCPAGLRFVSAGATTQLQNALANSASNSVLEWSALLTGALRKSGYTAAGAELHMLHHPHPHKAAKEGI